MKKILSTLMALFVVASLSFAQVKPTATTTHTTQHVKKDGTADKRFKENKHKKKDGTPDKRYKENKIKK
ncbi:MAG: hypothetical protein QM727_03035 [Niabella sp.]